MTLGDIIFEYRNTHEMSMREFARVSEMSVAYISMLERGFDGRGKQIVPSIKTINQVAKGCNTSFEDVFSRLDVDYVVKANTSTSDEENLIIELYRQSDDQTKEMVKRILAYKEGIEKL